MSAVPFSKYEGLGNDFVLVECDRDDFVTPEHARAICDRRLGVGADGVLLVLPSAVEGAAARMVVINADGSVPEMCGNGLRCVALHVARREDVARGSLVIETGAGLRTCTLETRAGTESRVTIDMGEVRCTGEVEIELDGEVWPFTLADAGNPHAITTRVADRETVERVGARVSKHPRFSRGTNVEFASFRSGEIDLVVYERGVGVTEACGTGACATVAVGVKTGWVPEGSPVVVHLPGGALSVTVRGDGHAIMTGPARLVFTGDLSTSLSVVRAR